MRNLYLVIAHNVFLLVIALVNSEISERFSYFGGYPEPTLNNYSFLTLSCLISNIIFYNALRLRGSLSLFVLSFLCVTTISPALMLNSLNPEPSVWLMVGISLFWLATLIGLRQSRFVSFPSEMFMPNSTFTICSIATIAVSIFFFQSHSFLEVATDIYGARQNMRDTIPFPGAERVYHFASRFGIVFLICYGVIYRNLFFLICGLIAAYLLFLIAGHKSIFILCLMALSISMLINLRFKETNIILFILIFLIFIYIIEVLSRSVFLTDFLFRRVIILPGHLHYYYFDQFLFDPNWLRIKPIPDGEVAFHISQTYFGRDNMRANSSIISSSVISLGFLTLSFHALFFGTLLGILEKFTESFQDDRHRLTVSAICFCYGWSFSESGLFVVIFTHGLVLVFLPWVFYLVARKKKYA